MQSTRLCLFLCVCRVIGEHNHSEAKLKARMALRATLGDSRLVALEVTAELRTNDRLMMIPHSLNQDCRVLLMVQSKCRRPMMQKEHKSNFQFKGIFITRFLKKQQVHPTTTGTRKLQKRAPLVSLFYFYANLHNDIFVAQLAVEIYGDSRGTRLIERYKNRELKKY